MAKNTFYFSHDGNARNDEKLLAVRMRLGAEGYAIYFMILEKLLESTNYISIKDYNILAFDFRVGADKVKTVVEEFGLFEFTEDKKHFYSPSFIDRMKPLDNMREQRRVAGLKSAEKRAKSTKVEQNSTVVERVLGENSTKESKVKESKVNNNILLEKESKGGDLNSSSENSLSINSEKEKKEKSSAKKEKELEYIFPSEEFKAQWQLWKAYRKKKDRFQYIDANSEKRALNELKTLSNENEKEAIAIILQSIDKGWKGFFPLKNKSEYIQTADQGEFDIMA